MKQWILIITLSAFANSVAAEEQPFDGAFGYKFGTTIAGADSVKSDDKLDDDCGYQNLYPQCLRSQVQMYGHLAEIVVQFDKEKKLVSQILLKFNLLQSTHPNDCLNMSNNLASELRQKYKEIEPKRDGKKLVWVANGREVVSLTSLCITNETGIVAISYQ